MLSLREQMRQHGAERALTAFAEDELDHAWEVLTWWRSLHARPLSSVAANLRYHVGQEQGHVNGRVEVTQRLKRLPTIVEKLERERGRVTQMHDIGGVRALLPSLRHVHALSRRLRKTWTIIRVRDYIAEPKSSGYRALHLIVERKGFAIEVQLRTIAQDVWANVVETQSREQGVGFKFGAGPAAVHAQFKAISDILAQFDRGELPQKDLLVALKSMQ